MLLKQFIVFLSILVYSTIIFAEDDHDHDDDAHVEVQEPIETDEHDHDHETDDDHEKDDDHESEFSIELTSEAIALGGIVISKVKHGQIGNAIDLSGEVSFNEDRLVHITPRFPGIALKANFRVGEYVNAGEIVAIVESNESMNSYSITAPISGWVIERHITTGEFVSTENSIFIIADLSTVWLNLAVYPKDANLIKKGQIASINAIGSKSSTEGIIEYVTPIVDLKTRSATARITLQNKDNKWRPGTFVQATIVINDGSESYIVEKDAVQSLFEKNVIFVTESPNKFTPKEVHLGDSDRKYIQILSGITENTRYVSHGAFELKAQIVTSNLDAHAGHGH